MRCEFYHKFPYKPLPKTHELELITLTIVKILSTLLVCLVTICYDANNKFLR